MFVDQCNPDIIAITELYPKNYIFSPDSVYYNIDGYDLYMSDSSSGRGVGIYTKTCLNATILNFDTTYKDHIWCQVKLLNNNMLVIGCIYRSPNCSRQEFTIMTDLIKEVTNTKPSHLLIMGDFNMKEINWEQGDTSVSEDHIATLFLENIRDCYLFQHVHEPTRYRHDNTPSILDLVLTNEEDMVDKMDYQAGLGSSDHIALVFNFTCFTHNMNSPFEKRNFFKGDYISINQALHDTEWDSVFRGIDLCDSWDILAEKINEYIGSYVPVSRSSNEAYKNKTPKSRLCIDAINNKHRKWLKYKYCRTNERFEEYKVARNRAANAVKNSKYNHEKDLALRIKDNNKLFWSYVRSKTKTKKSVCKLNKGNGELTNNEQDTANVLNDYFASVFEVENDNVIPSFEERAYTNTLSTIEINEDLVLKSMKRINPSKSPGPDMFHPNLIRQTEIELSKPLTHIYQKSLAEGKLPDIWKCANVTAIYKNGDKNEPCNYRPISLTSVPGKIMERIIRDALVDHMSNNNLFCDEQHGFIKGKSCVTQLLEFMEDVTEALDQGCEVDIIYLDFCKSFDKVPHKRLLEKLKGYGIRDNILMWIQDFLSNRKQRVSINGRNSEWRNVTSGIPQGSVLGPILFLIYINDLPSVVRCLIKLFADDAKLYQIIRRNQDRVELQGDISNSKDWSIIWKMFFNIKKNVNTCT